MAGEGGREGPDISRRIRDELERIREAESRVEEALEAVRQARRRVEVVARELGREEERVRAWVREEMKIASGPAAVGGEPSRGVGGLGVGGPAASDSPRGGDVAGAAEPIEERSSAGEPGPRSWRSDASLGWANWRERAARAREPSPALSGEPTPEGALPEDRRPAAPEVETWTQRPAEGPLAPTAALPPIAALPPGSAASGPGSATPSGAAFASFLDRRLGFALLAALAVVLVGWFAIRGLRQRSAPPPVATQPPIQTAPPAAPPAVPGSDVATPAPEAGTEAPGVAAPASPLAQLPEDPAARQALYDSLFDARAPFFDTLLATVHSETGSAKPLQRALADWKTGSVDAQDADLIHSALLQHVLKQEIDPRIEIDGQVLRNPCRGRSCSALLNVWEHQQAKYGLPPVPDNAPTDARALRQAEAVLVLGWLRDANQGGGS